MGVDRPNYHEHSEDDRRSPAALRQETRDQVAGLLTEVAPVVEDARRQINAIAKWAVSREDADMVHSCVELAENLPQENRLLCAEAYIAGMRSGDIQAFTTLMNYVKNEAAERREELIEYPEREFQPSSYDYGFLHSIVKDYGEHGQSADEWIDNFAITPTQSFELKLMHAKVQADNQGLPPTMQRMAQARFEELLQFTTQEGTDPEYFTQVLHSNWSAIKNPELRETLVNRYVGQLEMISPRDEDALQVHLAVAHNIIGESEFEVDWYVDVIDQHIDQWAAEISLAGGNNYELARIQLPWRMRMQELKGAPVEDFVECLDVQIGDMLNIIATDDPTELAPSTQKMQNQILALREQTLKIYARAWAKDGRFDDVQPLAAASMDRGNILRECLKFAKTQAEIDKIRPDDLILIHDESLNTHLQIAEARCNGDDRTFYQWADELLTQADSDIAEATDIIRAMHDSLEGQRQQQFGQHMLHRLRETPRLPITVANFSRRMIAAGDVEEAWNYFEYVITQVTDPAKRLEYLMWNIDYIHEAGL